MPRLALAACLVVVCSALASATRSLEIVFIDVEGGQATLVVTPAGESLLIDAGYGGRNGRDPERVMAALRDAGVARIDYFLATHFHNDHVGGVPELAARVAIDTFIDYGEPLGTDRMSTSGFRAYEPLRQSAQRYIEANAGDRLPLRGVEAVVVSAGGRVLTSPLDGGGGAIARCATAENHVEDGTENYRSVGVMIRLGAFRFLALGDLSGNTLTGLACPTDMLGSVSVYQIAHHGAYDSNVPALYDAIRPQVAIMNNGGTKGGAPDAFRTLHALATPVDLWQLHASRKPGAENAPDDFLANLDDADDGHSLRLSANDDGTFRVVNGRTGFARTYESRRGRTDSSH